MSQCTIWGFKSMCEGYPPPSDVWKLSPLFWCVSVIIGYPPPSDVWRLSPLFWCVTVIISYPPLSDVWRLSPSFWCVTVIIGYPPPSDVWRLSPLFWCVTVIILLAHEKAVMLVLTIILALTYLKAISQPCCGTCKGYHPLSWQPVYVKAVIFILTVWMLPSLFWHVKAVTPVLKCVTAIILVLMCEGCHPCSDVCESYYLCSVMSEGYHPCSDIHDDYLPPSF